MLASELVPHWYFPEIYNVYLTYLPVVLKVNISSSFSHYVQVKDICWFILIGFYISRCFGEIGSTKMRPSSTQIQNLCVLSINMKLSRYIMIGKVKERFLIKQRFLFLLLWLRLSIILSTFFSLELLWQLLSCFVRQTKTQKIFLKKINIYNCVIYRKHPNLFLRGNA